jgi:hypothetical protein
MESAGKQGVLLASLGTIAELGELPCKTLSSSRLRWWGSYPKVQICLMNVPCLLQRRTRQ